MCHSILVPPLVLSLLVTSPVLAATWTVDPGGGGDFTEIQPAVVASSAGDVILVNAGTYEELVNYLGKDIEVRSTSGPAATVIRPPGGVGSAAIFENGETAAAVLDGFTLRDGNGTDYLAFLRGGGALCIGASPTFRDCHFVNNFAHDGGAVYVQDGAEPSFHDCEFRDNSATIYGGAIAGVGALMIEDCLFENNEAIERDGGALYALDPCLIERCTFRDNEARTGGAIEAGGPTANHTIRDCWFEGNIARLWHGAGVRSHEASLTIEGCVFVDNWANEDGAAVMVLDGGTTTVSQCTFWANESDRFGGTLAAWYNSTLVVSHSIIAGTHTLPATYCGSGGQIEFACNAFWDNPLGDVSGGCLNPVDLFGNFSADPRFCDADGGDFTLRSNSPCAPPGVTGCGLVGALPVGCGPVSVAAMSWGQVKGAYR
ncbi:right-handed parallel beta-helix repeat-containing protein [bacterium]|nr:right-handed parallel beta-helix repeat-containing protein [bacterium]